MAEAPGLESVMLDYLVEKGSGGRMDMEDIQLDLLGESGGADKGL